MNANVRPGCAYVAASAFSPFRVAVLVIKTGTPGTSTSISLRTVSASVHTSDLFNTTTASAPLSFAATRNRWMRLGLKFWSSPLTKNTVSMFAATICSISSEPEALRENFVRRGNTTWISALASPSRRRTPTQSPTAGN